jgi:hypothetical protein
MASHPATLSNYQQLADDQRRMITLPLLTLSYLPSIQIGCVGTVTGLTAVRKLAQTVQTKSWNYTEAQVVTS